MHYVKISVNFVPRVQLERGIVANANANVLS